MTTQAPDVIALNRIAVETTVEIAASITSESLARPTPCAGWAVRELLGHMTGQHLGFAAAATGKPTALEDFAPVPIDGDPIAVYRLAADDVLAAFAEDGVLTRAFHLPEISPVQTFPGRVAIGFHLLDYVVHAWDLARGLDVPLDLDPALTGITLAIARQVPAGDARTKPGAAFQPVLADPAGPAGSSGSAGSALDQALRLLGRDPAWTPAV
jgi:uncharacterized protein (TIGR03086 family)